MKFEDYRIAPQIKRNLEGLGFKKPTDIQYKSIPPILKGEDVLAIAQTGTGKTAAFAIPVVSILSERKMARSIEGIKCLVMVPTRELAIQITSVFEKIARYTNLKVFSVFGGVEQGPQIARLENGIDILIATPGRMFDLVSQGYIRLQRVEILILDEADHMLDLGFIKDIQDLMKFLPRKRQTLFFSATINEKIKKLAYSLVHNAIRIQISPNDPVARNIDHSVAFVGMDDKRFFLERLIREHPDSKILVFVRTKVRAERVMKALERVNISSQTIHGDKEQKDRLQVLNQFRDGSVKVLIATDVSARGIDIANVDYVVNYDLPEQPENYVHRVGRTGRGTQKGQAFSFCSPEEKPILSEIEKYLTKPIRVVNIDNDTYEETVATSDAAQFDLKALLKEAEEFELGRKKRKK
ncbi:DEAD/DEAH box helicase [Larkinella arboricola]|uniref:ATP-dependent RNA helicase RhlE n=1 Tax=Larkinella arboricola TaxID=643671 RepID=A0A327WW94_LARAB|nr:DEAD/DEAH box helicase [Larkinella arboricola]RAJ95725.1 ATP-dependent RNA helicase RhlE [Larkinella arboricola]